VLLYDADMGGGRGLEEEGIKAVVETGQLGEGRGSAVKGWLLLLGLSFSVP
jgi:hypothetical protein